MSNGWPNRDKQMRSVAEDADALRAGPDLSV
jgi:hypothetical protein